MTKELKNVKKTSKEISEYFFCRKEGQPLRDIRTSFNNALKRAGIKDFTFHDLRHTFASYMVMSGVDLATVKELLGHKDIKMTLRYSHLSPGHKRDAVEMISGRLRFQTDNKTDNKKLCEKKASVNPYK